MILAGDIGGTNARLALYAPGKARPAREASIPSREHASLESVVLAFLGKKPPKIQAATFGIAGPVVLGRVKTTNLPWAVDEKTLARRLGIPHVHLINDLVALALGAVNASAGKLRSLTGGSLPAKKGQNLAIIAAGTGLGEAGLVWTRGGFVPLGSEGGHADFAPRSIIESELLEFLSKRYGDHVSNERVVSGPGLGNVYDFFRDGKGMLEATEISAQIAAAPDRNAEIGRLGVAGTSPVASRALQMFMSVYGAETGNLALKVLATGGVYVAGTIAASLQGSLAAGPFVPSFTGKGRMKSLLEKIPVAVVTDSKIGLAGAAHHAESFA